MAKIVLETSCCVGCGACVAKCPQLFEIRGDGKSHFKESLPVKFSLKKEKEEIENSDREYLKCAEEAAAFCPFKCISIKN